MPVAGFGETPFRVVGLPGELRHPIGQDGQPLRGTDAGQPVPAAPDLVVRLVGAVEAGAGLRHVRTGGVDCGCADVQLLLVPRQFPVGAVRSREHPLAARGEVRPFQVEVTGVLDGGALRGGPAGRVGVCEGTAGFGLGLARLLDGALRVVGGALELFDAVGGADGGEQVGLAAQRLRTGGGFGGTGMRLVDPGHECVDAGGQQFQCRDPRPRLGLRFGSGVCVAAELLGEDLDLFGRRVPLDAGTLADALVVGGAQEFQQDPLPVGGVRRQEPGEVALGQDDALAEVVEGQSEKLFDGGVEFLDLAGQDLGLRPVRVDGARGGVGEPDQADGLLLDLPPIRRTSRATW